MDIEGTYTFQDAPVERVWQLLLDPQVLARTIPGCDRLEPVGEDTYEATMNVGVSAVKGVYTGRVTISDKQAPHHFHIAVEGSGTRGFIKGEGTLDLTQQNGHTVARYKGTAQLGGAIAGVGMRMVGGAAKMLINQFFGAISDELRQQAPAATVAGRQEGGAGDGHGRVIVRPPAQLTSPMVQVVRRLRISDGSPEDEQRWAQRLMMAGAGLLVGLLATVGLLVWLIGRKRE
jgi:carbon monoxide dehydrogenase subunit G